MLIRRKSQENGDQFDLRHGIIDRIIWGFSTLAIFYFFTIPFYMNSPKPHELVIYYFIMTMLLWFSLSSLYRSFSFLELYKEGILSYRLFSQPQFLAWSEITVMKGWLWSQALILSNPRKKITIRVETEYTDGPVIPDILWRLRPDMFWIDNQMTFYKSPAISLFLSLGSIMMLALGIKSFSQIDYLPATIFFALSISTAYWVIIDMPNSISIADEFLTIKYLFKTRVIHGNKFSDISRSWGLRILFDLGEVSLHFPNGKRISILFFNLGSPLLYAFLSLWWTHVTTPRLMGQNVPYYLPDIKRKAISDGK